LWESSGMANQAFTTLATNPIKAQPVAEGLVVVRSTSPLETVAVDIYGTISGSPGISAVGSASNVEDVASDSLSAIYQVVTSSAAVGTITGHATGIAAVGDARVDVNPSDGDTLTIGLAGVALVYRFKNTLAAANDVKIGATIQDTASNLSAAINLGAGSGTSYHGGTAQNPFLSATVSVAVVELTDRIACSRQLDWVLTESASNFSKRLPIGGVDGLLLFSISPGGTFAADALTFSTEDHLTATLPALMVGTSPSVAINGGSSMLRVWGDNALKFKVESSTDLINWHPTSEGEITLVADTLTNIVLAQLHEYIRFVITENLNTDDTILDARVIW